VRCVFKAIGVTAVAIGVLTLLSRIALDWWAWQAFLKSLGPEAVGHMIVDPPPPGPAEAAIRFVLVALALCAVGAVFTAAVVWPVTIGTRRIFREPLTSRLVAVVVIAAVSALAFTAQTSPSGPWHPSVVFATGSTIGIVASAEFARMLPPNISLERTRGR
jgi:hypothetical protein